MFLSDFASSIDLANYAGVDTIIITDDFNDKYTPWDNNHYASMFFKMTNNLALSYLTSIYGSSDHGDVSTITWSDTPYCSCGAREITIYHFFTWMPPLCCTRDCHTGLDRAKHTPITFAYAWCKQTDYYFIKRMWWFSYYRKCFYI